MRAPDPVAPPPQATIQPQMPDPQPAPRPAPAAPSINTWRTPEPEPEREPRPAAPPTTVDEDASVAVRALRRGMMQQPPAGEADDRMTMRPDLPVTPLRPDLPALDEGEPPFGDDDDDDGGASQFDYRAPFTRRRNTVRMWTYAAAIFALLATGTIVAVNYYGLPDWVPLSRPTFGIGQPGLKLDFPQAEQRPETLENGETIFRVRGSISNTSRDSLAVPNLLVVFSDARERNIGDWVVVPAKRRLAPGENVVVTEAIANIPPGAAVADLGWAPG